MTRARRPEKSPLRALLQGLCAGAIGTAVFTAYEVRVLQRGAPTEPPRDWSEASEPAQVGRRVLATFFGRRPRLDQAGLLANLVHWSYGTCWGPVYAVIQESARRPLLSGLGISGAELATDYTVLPAMGVYQRPRDYPAPVLAKDAANHVVHGLAVALAYRALEPAFARR